MSQPSGVPNNTFQRLAIDKTTFVGLQWGCWGVATLLVAFRGYVRFTVFRRFFADDALVLLAYVLLFAGVIMWHIEAQSLYDVFDVIVGKVYPPPASFFDRFGDYTQSAFASGWLILFGLWSVKFSFLLFFKKLGQNVKGQKWLWWGVFAATWVALTICVGVQDYQCTTKPVQEVLKVCSTQEAADFIQVSQQTQVGTDVATDILILLIPFHLLWHVQISLRNKIYLAGIFSLTLFTMIVAIVRVVLTFAPEREDGSNLYSWATIELAVSIIIACLASYRSLFNKQTVQSRKYNNKNYGASWPGSSGSGKHHHHHHALHQKQPSGHSAFVQAGAPNGSFHAIDDGEGEDDTPLRAIKVRQDLSMYKSPV